MYHKHLMIKNDMHFSGKKLKTYGVRLEYDF